MSKHKFKKGDIVRCVKGGVAGAAASAVMRKGMLGVVHKYDIEEIPNKKPVNIIEVVVPKDGDLLHLIVFEENLVAYADDRKQNRPQRLYVWSGDDVLAEYYGGIAFALAYSADQARRLILASSPDIIGTTESVFLKKAPDVFNRPVAFTQRGGS